MRWREVKPFLWLNDASGSHLGALVQDGKVRWLSTNEDSPVLVYLPVPVWQSTAWNASLLFFAIAVFLFTVLLWPVAALVRRHYRQPGTPLSPLAYRWYRWSRIAAILHLMFIAGWLYVLSRIFADIAHLNTGFDGTLRLIQLIGVVAIISTLAAIVNAYYAWREHGGWWRKLNSVALVLAGFVTLWFAFNFHLINVYLNY